jgi:hypothetical protein
MRLKNNSYGSKSKAIQALIEKVWDNIDPSTSQPRFIITQRIGKD